MGSEHERFLAERTHGNFKDLIVSVLRILLVLLKFGNININSALVLLQQSRLFTTCITPQKQNVVISGSTTTANVCGKVPNLKPGRYTATLSAYYGQNGNPTQEVTGTTSFWYLPWWFIITVIVILVVLIGIVWWIVRMIRRRLYGRKEHRVHRRF